MTSLSHIRLIRAVHALLALVLLFAASVPGITLAQTPTPVPAETPDVAAGTLDAQVENLLAQMSIADRVGQLFLITFEGSDAGFESDIAELIYGYRVGGVVISASNGNFSNEKGIDTPAQVATLVNQLQSLAYGAVLPPEQALPESWPDEWPPEHTLSLEQATGVPPINIPLFIAVEQTGDSLPATSLRRNFTPLPSQLALGATWNPGLTQKVGAVVGRELQAVGINLLLGPNLDVLEQPRPESVGTQGTHSFGGDPYWVSQMGRAYISGVHTGSGGRLATIARYFPGAGDADRLQEQEVATVQRSVEELRRTALPPFLAVTRNTSTVMRPDGDAAATDGLMTGHIRYSGFQGSSLGRNTPFSLAPELTTVLTQEGFAEWRDQGGLLVSNMLGAPSIRRYYDPSLTEFPYRRVATDAFSAGHDLLYLGRFSLDDRWESQKQNIQDTISFFQVRYSRDRDFAAQVDAAVRRILRLKLSLYGPPAEGAPYLIPPANVLVTAEDLTVLAEENRADAMAIMDQVARESFTLLYPDPASTSDVVSMVPQTGDEILIFTDSRLMDECDDCMAEVAVGPDEIASIIERLYGPSGTGQILPDQVKSLTFSDLAQLLDAEQAAQQAAAEANGTPDPDSPTEVSPPVIPLTPTPTITTIAPPAVETELDEPVGGATPLLPGLDKNSKTNLQIEQAEWILFVMLDVDTEHYPTSDVVKRFLRQRANQLAEKHIAVLSLHAPFFLDATEISKLNGYYAAYSKTQPFLESAVRALFRAYSPTGAPPISIPGTRYGNLADRLQPDPSRAIDLVVATPEGDVLIDTRVADAGPLPQIEAGQTIRVQAGPVLDRNGKVVRNGTPVELRLTDEDNSSEPVVETVQTQNGLATRDLVVNSAGVVLITARAGEAVSAEDVALNVQMPASPEMAAAAPLSNTAPMTVAAAITAGLATSVAGAADVAPGGAADDGRMNLVSLAVALLTMIATSSLLLIVQVRVLSRQALVHGILWAINCGLIGYILYGLGLIPGGSWLDNSLQVWGSALVVFIAMLLPLVWLQLRME